MLELLEELDGQDVQGREGRGRGGGVLGHNQNLGESSITDLVYRGSTSIIFHIFSHIYIFLMLYAK